MIGRFDYESIASMIDHTLLDPALTDGRLEAGCELAICYKVASVCIVPYALARAVQVLAGSGVRTSTTIGLPHGCDTTAVKLAEVGQALRDGGEELDAVLNICKARSGDWFYVENELRRLVDAAHVGGAKIKVVFESAYLDEDAKIRLCEICAEVDADGVKASADCAASSAMVADLLLMRRHAPAHMRVMAAGGADDLDTVLAMRDLGVSRVGTQHSREILDECRRQLRLEPIGATSGDLTGAARF